MKNSQTKILIVDLTSYVKKVFPIIALLLIVGCSGGGEDSSDAIVITGTADEYVTGQFIDGPVSGLTYICSSGKTGVTNQNGKFTCKKGDTVTFQVGNVVLGSAIASSVITPVTLYPDNPDAATNVAQLLQTLDDDGDLTSFSIDETKALLLDESLDVTSDSFDTDAESMLLQPLKDESSAISHLNESIALAPGAINDPLIVVSDIVVSDIVVSDPIISDTIVSDPVVSDPIVSDPVVSDPIVSDPIVSDPVVSDPIVSDPVVSDPIVSEPVASEPVASEPVASEPVVSEPVASEPVVSEPAPSSENLITNGTFDTDVIDWTGNNGTVYHATAINGRDNVLAIADAGAEFSSATQSFTTVIGREYEIVGLSYFSNLTVSDLRIYSAGWSAAAGDILNVAMTASSAWETLATQRFTATSTRTTIALMSRGTQTAYFDEVLVRPASGPMPIGTTPIGTSPYLEEVTLPTCDATDPEVQFISTNSDWSSINDTSKRVFCVFPGDYRGVGTITLTADGTPDARRYIFLDNGNDAHPASLSELNQANVQINLSGANYWTIDRMSTLNTTASTAINIKGLSKYNVISRMHIKNFNTYAITIYHGSHNNTIQNSRIAEQSLAGRKSDGVGIFFQNDINWRNDTYIYNTKIIQNEFRNISDSIQLIRRWRDWATSDPVPTGYDGTIIDSNHIYISPEIYTDGKGNHTPSGNYAYAENAIDLKAGSDDVNNKVIITNNFMWGYRIADKTGSYLSSWGNAVAIHYGVNNLILDNNYIFDSARGIGAGDSKGFSYGLGNSSISNNILWDITDFDLVLWASDNLTVDGNIIHGATYWASFNTITNSTLVNNVIINAGKSTGTLGSGTTISNTFNYANFSEANQENLTFTTDLYATPRTITLDGAAPTTSSPYYDSINIVVPTVK